MIFSYNFSAMGCGCEIRVHSQEPNDAERAFALASNEVERIEAKYLGVGEKNDWQQLVSMAGSGHAVEVDDETAQLLDMAELGYAVSEGLFDVTLTPLLEIWDWHGSSLPGNNAIADAMSRSGWSRVDWQRPLLELPDIGMQIDLGGLVKEYAADASIRLLQDQGFPAALVDLGGDVAASLENEDDEAWQVEIRQSRENDQPAAVVLIANGGLATRGDFDRCMVVSGLRYSHMLDPRTGWPVQGLASVSVLAPKCVTAGVLATTAMVLGPDRGPPWLQRMDVGYLCTDSAGSRSGTLKPPASQASSVA